MFSKQIWSLYQYKIQNDVSQVNFNSKFSLLINFQIMKKIAFLLSFLMLSVFSFAQPSPKVVTESGNVKVTYGQPSKKNREIFGKRSEERRVGKEC